MKVFLQIVAFSWKIDGSGLPVLTQARQFSSAVQSSQVGIPQVLKFPKREMLAGDCAKGESVFVFFSVPEARNNSRGLRGHAPPEFF